MASLPAVDTKYLIDFLSRLLNTPSPTGFCEEAMGLVAKNLGAFSGLKLERTRKGALIACWQGQKDDAPRALTAHVDTLGAMVKEIKPDGRLKMSRVGSFAWNTVEGEGCWVHPSQGRKVRGSILLNRASTHVTRMNEMTEATRDDDHMEVRLDARTSFADETEALGIRVGDFITFDPRVEVTKGFIRSRHLDDKAGVASIVGAIKALSDSGLQPVQTTTFLFSNYEEVGHGAASGVPGEVQELIVVDMAAVGEGQESDEFHASICLKDSGGPYHHALSLRLRELAEKHKIPYKTDIYPYYGSDGEAAWHAGADVAVALVGPGIDASHNYERTHTEALEATCRWLVAYLMED